MAEQQLTASVQGEPLPGRPYPRIPSDVTPQDMGSGIGQGLKRAGAVVAAVQQKEENQANQRRVMDANSQLTTAADNLKFDPQKGAYTLKGNNAVNLPALFGPQLDQAAEQIKGTLTPKQQDAFQAHRQILTESFHKDLMTHELQQTNEAATASYNSAQATTIQSGSLNYKNPQATQDAKAQLRLQIEAQGNFEGWSPDQRQAAYTAQTDKLNASVIDRALADKNLGIAQHYYKDNKGEMSGPLQYEVENRLDAEQKRLQAEAWAKMAPVLADMSAAYKNGLPYQGAPSNAAIAAAVPERKDALRIIQGLQADKEMGVTIRDLGTKTPDEVQSILNARKPTVGGPGVAENLERYNVLLRAANQDYKSRGDMAQYAQDNGLGWNPLKFNDPQSLSTELRTRESTAIDLSRQVGSEPKLLSKDETKILSKSLDSMPADRRLQYLDTLRTSFTNDSGFSQLMREVMPNSPVTGIAGELGARENPREKPPWYTASDVPANGNVRELMLKGEALLNPQGDEKTGGKKSAFPMPPDEKMRAQWSAASGNAFRDNPQMEAAYYEAFRSYYAGAAQQKGDYSGGGAGKDPDPKLVKQSVAAVIGNTSDYFGSGNVAIPFGMSKSNFKSYASEAMSDKLKAAGFTDEDVGSLRGYTLSPIGLPGSGRYYMTQGNHDVVGRDGQKLVVDLYKQYDASHIGGPSTRGHPATAEQQSVVDRQVREDSVTVQ